MRWTVFGILAYLLLLLQSSLGGILTLQIPGVGHVRPDIPAILVVFLGLYVRDAVDAMLAGWIMGFAIDLTTGAGPGVSTVVGPMSLSYALGAGAIFVLREVVFREKLLTRCIMTLVFCLLSHGTWVTLQWLLAFRTAPWGGYLQMLVQVVLVALYTGALTPLAHLTLGRGPRWLSPWIAEPPRLGRR